MFLGARASVPEPGVASVRLAAVGEVDRSSPPFKATRRRRGVIQVRGPLSGGHGVGEDQCRGAAASDVVGDCPAARVQLLSCGVPVTCTASLKSTVMEIVAPVVYTPVACPDVTPSTDGAW